MGKKLNFTATLCIVLLFATLIASHRRGHRSSHGSGHGSRRCWYLDRVECDEPGNLTDGTVSYSGRGFEDTVTYSCSSGFELVGLSTRTCLSNGSWIGTMPTCVFAGCGPLSGPTDHGYLSVTGQLLGHTATTFCDTGYEVTGSKNRTCLESGWSGSPADCARVSCPTLSNPQFGSISTSKGTKFEDEAIYKCNEGFEMVGNSRRCCQSTGSWSGTAPICKQIVTCPALLAPSDGTVSVSGPQQIGSTVLYTCTYGLNTGNLERSCLRDGSWSGSQPTCSQACPSLSPPLNGDLRVTGLSINDKATVSCDVGFVITGPAERSCTMSGWDGSATDCVPVSCPALSKPQFGSISTSKGTEFEDEAIYECNEGFEMAGNSRRCCKSTGSWSGTAPTCKQIVTCPALVPPSNGTVSVSGPQQIGSTVLYTCTYGLNTGNLERNCLSDGTWSGSQPTCSQACQSLSTPLNGDLRVTGLSINDKATVTCDVGFVITGSAERSCTSSGWDGLAADCVPVSCPSLSNPQYGSLSTPKRTEFEDEAIYKCDDGFELLGNSQRSCRSTGSWSGTAPTCKQIVQCSALMDPDDGTVDVSGPQPIGSTATFSCEFGLVGGSLVRYCLAGGIWSGMDPICVAACSSLLPPLNGDLNVTGLRVGHTATVTCDVGFVITGTAKRSCTSSGWDGSAADCVPVSCLTLFNIHDGSVSTPNGTDFQDEAIYECKRGFELVGNSRRYCRSTGSWSGTAPTCKQIDCGKDSLPQPNNGVTTLDVADVATYGATATQACNPGYTPSAEGLKLSCSDTGLWEHVTLTCTIKNCGKDSLPQPSNGVTTLDVADVATYGATATQTCNPGYTPSAEGLKLSCSDTGLWEHVTLTCTIKNCGKDSLPQPNNGVTTLDVADVATYGATATQTCNPGYSPSAEGLKLSCSDTGLWEYVTLTCTIKNCGAPPILANGVVQLDGSNTTTYDAEATLNCNEGHEAASNQDKIKCLETGQWAEITRVCAKKDCSDPPVPTHGSVTLAVDGVTIYNAEATQSCDTGYSLSGEESIRCSADGRWSSSPVVCTIKNCGKDNLPQPSNGVTTLDVADVATYGATATQTCNPGYSPSAEDLKLSCSDTGLWEHVTLTCTIKNCGAPPILANGVVQLDDSNTTTYDAEATLNCNEGHETASNQDKIKCLETGHWAEITRVCTKKDCLDPPVPTNGSVTLAGDGVTTYNAEATQSCDTGYSLSGEESIRCTADGSWSSSPVVCTIKKWSLKTYFYDKDCTSGSRHIPAQDVERYKNNVLPVLLKDFDYEYQRSSCFNWNTYEFTMRIRFDKPMSESDIHTILYSLFLVYTSESYGFGVVEIPARACNTAIDVVFVVDASGSVGLFDFPKQLDFMIEFVQACDIGPGPNQVQVGAITFDHEVYNQFNMSTFSTKGSLSTAIWGINFTEGGTVTNLALDYVRTNSFTTAAGDRPGVPNVAIVLTDGQSLSPTATSTAAAALQASTTVIGIGVGQNAPVDEIKAIASGTGYENTYFLDFNDLSTILEDLKEKVCPAT